MRERRDQCHVHKHVLDELVGRKAVDRVALATSTMREVGKDLFPVFARISPPRAGGIDQVCLDIEDELVTCEGTAGSGALVSRLFWQPKTAACMTLSCERLVERSEGRGGRT
jgi:hypothetical protein